MERGLSGHNGSGMRFTEHTSDQVHMDGQGSQEFGDNVVNWRHGPLNNHHGMSVPPQGMPVSTHPGVHHGMSVHPHQSGHHAMPVSPHPSGHYGMPMPSHPTAHQGISGTQSQPYNGMTPPPAHYHNNMTPPPAHYHHGMTPPPAHYHNDMTPPQPNGTQTSEHTAHGQDEELQEINCSQYVEDLEKKQGVAHRGKSFKPQEDRVICSGWLNISKDAVTGASQTGDAFYARLHRYYLDNWDTNSNRTVVSIQNRWTTIRKAVSKFCAILAGIRRRNESGKNDTDRVNEAITMYESSQRWQFGHCWEILRDEPKWNDYMVECNKPKQPGGGGSQNPGPSEGHTATNPGGPQPLERPEGRDSAKRRRSKGPMEDTASSAAVEMLQKIQSRGQEMDELDAKHRDEILQVERAKLILQEKALVAKIEQGDKKIELQREMSLEHIKLKRDVSLEQIKLKRDMMEVNRLQTEVQIMFTDLNTCVPSMRYWIAKKQREILIKDGINPDDLDGAGTSTQSDPRPPTDSDQPSGAN